MNSGPRATGELKECPSCGTRLPAAAATCSFCKARLGRCPKCRTWLVAGTQCLDCGVAAVSAAPAPTKAHSDHAFVGSAVGLLGPSLLQLYAALALPAAIVAGLAASGVEAIRSFLENRGVQISMGPVVAWAIVGGLVLLLEKANLMVHRARLRHTHFGGEPLELATGKLSWLWTAVSSVLIFAITGGLGLPWIFARHRRRLIASFVVPSRRRTPLEFVGTGDEVLGYGFLTILLLPLVVLTAGLLAAPVAWMWAKWEQKNLLVPDRNGHVRPVKFTGTFGGYALRWLLGWVLTLLTAGLYRPWARTAEWRWIASHTRAA